MAWMRGDEIIIADLRIANCNSVSPNSKNCNGPDKKMFSFGCATLEDKVVIGRLH
jgi:hypothetical protein